MAWKYLIYATRCKARRVLYAKQYYFVGNFAVESCCTAEKATRKEGSLTAKELIDRFNPVIDM